MTQKLNMDAVYSQVARCSACMHGTVQEGKAHCTSNGREIEFFSESYACPKGYWQPKTIYLRGFSDPVVSFDEDSKTLWLNKPDAKLEAELDAAYERTPGTLRWPIKDRPFLAQVWSLGRSVTSGPATPEVVEQRRKSCFGDATAGTGPCPALKMKGDGFYCAGCSCGTWMLANLDGKTLPKLGWAYLECPLKRPGFSNSPASVQ